MLGGCFGAGAPPAECVWDRMVATPKVDGLYMQTDPRQTWQTVVRGAVGNETSTTTLNWMASPGWTASSRPLSPTGVPSFEVVTVEPGAGKANATWAFEVTSGHAGCAEAERGSLTWDLAEPVVGSAAAPGQGVHVMTAGFLENGTLFYTNIPEVDSDLRWARTPWYAWEGDAALPVYVYSDDRAEQPAYWMAPSSQVPTAPPTGSPLDPILEETLTKGGATLDEGTGLGYFTTIRGFNEGLKGLSTTTTRVVRIAPEDAYTRPGYEEHDLYGEGVVFVIKVLDVVDAPCPASVRAGMVQVETPGQACTSVI